MRYNEFSTVQLEDRVPIRPGSGCTLWGGPSTYIARCEQAYAGGSVVARLGDRDDRISFSGDFAVRTVVTGGRGDDRLSGNDGRNRMAGGPGRDVLSGLGGSDTLFGGRDGDRTRDRLYGGPGSDQLFGSDGPNVMAGGPAADLIYPRDGSDRVRARDGAVDEVLCGKGVDTTVNDPFDFLIRCERSEPASESPAVPLSLHDEAPITSISGHRQLVGSRLRPPFESGDEFGLVVRVRSRTATGAPTDDAFPAAVLLYGDPFP